MEGHCAAAVERTIQLMAQLMAKIHVMTRSWYRYHAILCMAADDLLVCESAALPLGERVAARSSTSLPFPKTADPGALPIRNARHVPHAIETLRRAVIVGLAGTPTLTASRLSVSVVAQ